MEQKRALPVRQVDTKQEIHNHAVMALEPSDRGIVQAQLSPLLSDCTNAELKTVLLRVYNILGLRPENWPGNVPKDVTDPKEVEIIRDEKNAMYYDMKVYLPGVRIKDIEQAFMVGIAGNLKNSKGEAFDLNTYGNKFSFKYLGEVVTAYKEYSKGVLKQYAIKRKQLEQFPPVKPPLTQEQKEALEKEFFDDLVSFVEANKKLPAIWSYDRAYNHAWRVKEIKDTKEEQQVFKNRMLNDLKEEAEYERIKSGLGSFKEMVMRNAQPETLKYEYKKRRIISYLKGRYKL